MCFKFVKLLLLLHMCSLIESKGYFTIIGSKTIKHNSKYHLAISSQGYETENTLEIAIKSKIYSGSVQVVRNVTLINDQVQKIVFDMKGYPADDFELEVKSFSGDDDEFHERLSLTTNSKKYSVFVQTDKAIYKPSDKILFRVLVLNGDMKPFDADSLQVYILDGGKNRVKQFSNVTLHKGVFSDELQLSASPVLGNWQVQVKVDNEKEKTKDFEVAEYTLPKFEFKIVANPDANKKDGKIRATLEAKYTFGKAAKGNVSVEVQTKDSWREIWETQITKNFEIDGKKAIEFETSQKLGLSPWENEKTVRLYAKFVENLTEREQIGTAKVTIHSKPHKIELKASSESFKPSLPFSVKAIVKYHDKNAPVTDAVVPLKFKLEYTYKVEKICIRLKSRPWEILEYLEEEDMDAYFNKYLKNPNTKVIKDKCNKETKEKKVENVFISNGIAEINLDIPANTSRISIEADYLDVEATQYLSKAESESGEFIQLKAEKELYKVSEKVKIKVLSTEPMKKLTYQVVSLGKEGIISSGSFKVPERKEAEIAFWTTLTMVPKATVVAYYISENGKIVQDKIDIEFEEELQNFIDIKVSKEQVKPGEEITLEVNTKPESFIGLLGVDQSVLVLKSGNDIEMSTVFDEIKAHGGSSDEILVMTNAKSAKRFDIGMMDNFEYEESGLRSNIGLWSRSRPNLPTETLFGPYPAVSLMHERRLFDADEVRSFTPNPNDKKSQKEIEIRKDFPETWLWESFDLGSSNSNVILTKKVPDTMTSWIITGFSIDPFFGLGLTKQPSKFSVFQPFFVTTNLPYSIKRGEVVSIPLLVFNYMDNDQEAEVKLFNDDNEFEFVDVNEDRTGNRQKRSSENEGIKKISTKSQAGTTINFMIRPLKAGHIKIKVTASCDIAGDGLERQLIVEPEGITHYKNKAVFIDLRDEREFNTNFDIEIPSNFVPDSINIEASAIGDLLGPSIDNLDQLIKLPHGCGEQIMVDFVPNIVVLDYLTAVNQLTPEIELKAKTHMESGYQRELTYKHQDGSYSAFGKSDSSGSTWLTAFVVKSFRQASKYIEIDEEIVKSALEFLSKTQKTDGSFKEVGYILSKAMQGGASKGIALTAYTVITFLENKKYSKKYDRTIGNALNYIKNNINEIDDNYSLAISAFAMQLAKHRTRNDFLEKLNDKAVLKNGMKYWEGKSSGYGQTPLDVEMSAYALQAFTKAGRLTDAIAVMKWLVSQRNENGGFMSTQDTVVGLQALADLAATIYAPNPNIDITLSLRNHMRKNFQVNAENALVLQKHEIPSEMRNFEVTARGQGFSVFQVSYKYNMDTIREKARFTLEPKVHENSNKEFLHLVVCASFIPENAGEKSNMAVMEVTLPSGYTFDADALLELQATEKVKKIETKDGETVVVIYFDDLSAKKICPEVKSYRQHSVAKQKPASVIVYDYYDTSLKATSFYNPPEISLCDICNGADECKDDCEESEITT